MQKGLHNKIKPCGGYWDYKDAGQGRRAAIEAMKRKEVERELYGIFVQQKPEKEDKPMV